MPQDLYQWEDGGGLVHHCPKCYKPLTTPQARTRCLGHHVEWCRRYHTQLFKKGSSSECRPCCHGDEQHERRHREIAELVHKLTSIDPPPTPLTPLTPNALNKQDLEDDATPTKKTKKKDRKAAKKAQKIAEMPKVVNSAMIEHVGRVLHPNDYDSAEDEEMEMQLLNDPDIKDNRFFHKGTSNVRQLRNEFVKRDKKGDKVTSRVEAEEMEGILQLLNVSPITASTLPEEKRIIEELKQKIEKDLVQAREENEGFMMRKAGFWRWASKKAYNRLVANGRIWEDKPDGSHGAKDDESGESTEGDAVFSATSGDASDDTNITEPVVDDGVAEMIGSVATLTLSTPKTPKTPAPKLTADDGWMAVTKPKTKWGAKTKKATPKMTIKMSSNGGLAKMCQSSTPRETSFLRYHKDDE